MSQNAAIERLNPFADDDDDLAAELASFVPKAREEVAPKPDKAVEELAEAMGFPERAHVQPKPAEAKKPRAKLKAKAAHEPVRAVKEAYRTGRDQQFNIKAKAEDKARFQELSRHQEWQMGKTLAYALDALEVMLKDPDSSFWRDRKTIPR